MNTHYGNQYEEYVLNFLIKSNKYKSCFLWKNVPKEYLFDLELIDDLEQQCQDQGCDILCVTKNDKYAFIQCKNYSTTGKDNSITIDDLGLFPLFTLENIDLVEEHSVYYSGKVSHRLLKLCKKTKFINLPYITCKIDICSNPITLVPRSYQIEAYNALRGRKRSILHMPCGTGKTFVSYLLSLDYDNVVLLTPLISTTEQVLDHFKNYYQDMTVAFTEIDCSVNRNPNINFNTKNIIASTYRSCDVINKLLNKLKNCFVIIDEFHNLSENNLTNAKDEINKLLESNVNILFISATPKNTVNEKYFGNYKYILDWSCAIENKYICDINTIYPNNDELTKTIMDLYSVTPRLQKFNLENIDLMNQALFLLDGLKETNSKKCIIYVKNINKMHNFIELVQLLASLLNYKIKYESIDYKTSKFTRQKIMKEFKTCETLFLLCNVYTLNEGIDVPACDSIFILNPKYDPVNLPQRISRCNRIDSNNPNKIGHVFLWCKDKLDIVNMFNDLTKSIAIKLCNSKNKNFYNLNTQNNDNVCIEVNSTVEKQKSLHYCSTCNYNATNKTNLLSHYKTLRHKDNSEKNIVNKFEDLDKHFNYVIFNNEMYIQNKQLSKEFNEKIINEIKNKLTNKIATIPKITAMSDNNYCFVCTGCDKQFVKKKIYEEHQNNCNQITDEYKNLTSLSIKLIIQTEQLIEICEIISRNNINNENKFKILENKKRISKKELEELKIKNAVLKNEIYMLKNNSTKTINNFANNINN